MFKMVDVVGVSAAGFSEAVKDGVNKVLAAGEKVHFFQILEQRGAVREGELKEFQVVIRVATEFPEKS
jgi:flavin-binding protein dodecin